MVHYLPDVTVHARAERAAGPSSTATATAASALLTLANSRGPFRCTHCHRAFRRKWDCKMHTEAVHLKIKRYRCPRPNCGRLFAHRGTLTKHVRAVHDRVRPFPCPFPRCYHSFTERGNLNKHLQRVHHKN